MAAVDRGGADDVVDQLTAGSRRSSARPGPTASRSASASGRSSPWPAASCAISRCSWCSTSRRRPSTPRPSTPCSSASRRPRRPDHGNGHRTADGRITILVSHRFSTVRMADLIVVLDGARVVESGTHDELMAKGGQYARALRHPGGGVSLGEPRTHTDHARRGPGGKVAQPGASSDRDELSSSDEGHYLSAVP